ncbi:MAG: nucleotidyltransferase family protein [Woeseiaceae bacterium]
MILAAGRGERLRPISDTVPKALMQVKGEYLLDRHLRMLKDAGVDTVIINLGWLGEQIVDHVGSGAKFGVNVVYSPEYDQALETGGGIHRALPMLGSGPFWVVNSDVYTDMALPENALAEDEDAYLVLVPTPAHKTKSDFGFLDSKVCFTDNPDCTYSGIALYRPSFFKCVEGGRFSVAPMLFEAARDKRLGASLFTGLWEDVGTPERLRELNERNRG